MTVFSLRVFLGRVAVTLAGGVLALLLALVVLGRPWFKDREIVREVSVPEGRKVVGVAWRDGDMWVVTRALRPEEDRSEEYVVARADGWGITRERYEVREKISTAADAGVRQ